MSREEKNARQREYRAKNGNRTTKSYEKTHNGFLMRVYRNMQSRITGVQAKKAHLYEGKALLSREEFYAWAKQSVDFYTLFEAWEGAEYDRKLTPSVDRINAELGYELNNIRWVTHSYNSANTRRWSK